MDEQAIRLALGVRGSHGACATGWAKREAICQRIAIATGVEPGALEGPRGIYPLFSGVAWGVTWGGMPPDKCAEVYLRGMWPICMAETDISGRQILYQFRGVMVVHGPHKFPRHFPGVSAALDNSI